jgi:hypothetical protein
MNATEETSLSVQIHTPPTNAANYYLAKLLTTLLLDIRYIAWYESHDDKAAIDRLYHLGRLADLFHNLPDILKYDVSDYQLLQRIRRDVQEYQVKVIAVPPYLTLIDNIAHARSVMKNIK